MSNFFYRRLNFFNKAGSPLNFEYIGATGPSNLDSKFTYVSSANASSQGGVNVSQLDLSSAYIDLNILDLNGFDITDWTNEVYDDIKAGADIYLNGRVAGQSEFSGKITSITNNTTTVTVNFEYEGVSGQNLISTGNQIWFNTTYKNKQGGYFKGNIYFDPVSTGLYENEQIFVVQNFENSGNYVYGLPHTGVTGATAGAWRSRWYNDNYGETDVSEIIFTYKIDSEIEDGDGKPLIVSYPNIVHSIDAEPTDYLYNYGYVSSSVISSAALAINVALNATDLASNIYERKLIIEDITGPTPQKVIEIDFYGEIVGEDERFQVMLQNVGRAFYQSDSIILRDHDPEEPLPNYLEINEKRKELLLAGEEIFPYIGSYKGLVNAIKFFGYQDLRIKEYWLNMEYRALRAQTPLQENKEFLNAINLQKAKTGYSQGYQIGDVLNNPNSGKYKLVQTYGPNKDGEYVLDVSSEDTLLPSKTFKKTSLFGLYYDLNKTTGYDADYGYPEVIDNFQFTQEEVLIKLFALKERLKRDYLPLNARIIDITGEGVYFNIYNTKAWTDVMTRDDIESGFYLDVKSTPDFGFIEDLRNFSIRPSVTSIQTPSSYYNYYNVEASVGGGTGSAFYFTGIPATGPNPTLIVTAGKTYEFSQTTTGFDFYITTDPLLTQNDPIGLTGNGATSGGSNIIWYVNPQQTSPVYYYSSQNKTLLTGSITVLPSEISDLGNVINPLSAQQQYSATENESMISAISEYYTLKQQGEIVELGDGKYDPPAYIDPVTGLLYQTPIGMPIILELIVDTWTWDELNINWSSLLIPVFKVGSRVQVKSTGIFGTVTAVSYSTGQYTVLLDTSASNIYEEFELFSSIQNYSLLTWRNIDFSNMIDIEWIIDKPATQEGSPYHFEFRGSILDFYNLAHFIPYTGVYKVTCNVYDAFNAKTVAIKNRAIVVSPKVIDIDAWTRFREVEVYDWSNVSRSWDAYNSIWEFPAEGKSIEVLEKTIPREILDYATYGNKAEEGQDVYVKVNTDPIGATGYVSFTQTNLTISEITSYQIIPAQYSFANVICTTPHGLQTGDEVTILNTIDQLQGRWTITVPSGSSNVFVIPIIINSSWAGTQIYGTSPGPPRISVASSIYPNQYATGAGSIGVYVNGNLVGSAETGDSLYLSANAIVSSVNKIRTYPDYFASCENPSADPVTITITAPDNLGAEQNGVSLDCLVTGSLSLTSISTGLTGGVSPTETYVYWTESEGTLPNGNLKYWGTKRLNWDIFTDNSWNDGYAHTWYDFEFNNDWLGGFEIHNVQPGDQIKLSTGNEFYPYPIGTMIQPGVSVLTVQEIADQLNSAADPNITNFYYRPIPTESGDLSIDSPPVNASFDNTFITPSPSVAPPSQLGGSSILVASFTYSATP